MKKLLALGLIAVVFGATASVQAATPITAIQNFLAQPVQAATVLVRLSWTAPTSTNFTGVKILRRSGGPCPAGPNDTSAATVYDGSATSHNDTGVQAGTNYCYAAYAHDSRPVYASGVSASVVTPGAFAISAKATPSSGPAPLAVTYSATISGGRAPFTYLWQMGSNPPSTSVSPSTTWTTAGNYVTTVTVTDADGLTANSSVSVTVGAAGPALSATATASPTTGTIPLSVNFTATPVGGTAPYTYTWDFKDSQSSTQQNPTHVFSTAGTYAVSLTVRDSTNATANASVTVTASSTTGPSPITVTASANPSSGAPPLSVQFNTSASGGTSPYTYLWDFGDASPPSQAQNPSHTYQAAGTYTATVTVRDASSNTANKTVTVTATTSAGPAAPTNLQGTPGNTTALLTWTKAPAAAGTRLVRKLNSAATGPNDSGATVVYEGTAEKFHDSGLQNAAAKYYYSAYSYSAAPVAFSSSPTPVLLTINNLVPVVTDGLLTRITDSGFVVFWRTNILTEARVTLFDSAGTNVLAVIGADAGVNESIMHEVTLAYPIQRGAQYRVTVESISAVPASKATSGPGVLIGPFVDSGNNYWFGVATGLNLIPLGWNGTNSQIDLTKCDNTCNQHYVCRPSGIADCADPRNATFNTSIKCGNLAVSDCLDGRKDLPSGGNGTLTPTILQNWTGPRIPDPAEYTLVCSKWYQIPNSTGLQTRTQTPNNKQGIRVFGKSIQCLQNGDGSINNYDSRQIAPAGSWTP
jgi:PKD repeat protein